MKICFVNVTEESSSEPYLKLVSQLFKKIKRQDTEFCIKSVKNGIKRGEDNKFPFFVFYNKVAILEAGREAEREECDGILIGCFGEPALMELRSIVDIPVAGVAESSMHLAATMGWKFAIITLYEREFLSVCEGRIRDNGMSEKAIANPVRRLTMPTFDLFTKGMENPQLIIDNINEVADKAVADGAEVILTGCAALGPFFTMKGINVVGKEKVPIIDTVTASFKTLEMMIDYAKVTGCPAVSKVGFYAKPRRKDMERMKGPFGYTL